MRSVSVLIACAAGGVCGAYTVRQCADLAFMWDPLPWSRGPPWEGSLGRSCYELARSKIVPSDGMCEIVLQCCPMVTSTHSRTRARARMHASRIACNAHACNCRCNGRQTARASALWAQGLCSVYAAVLAQGSAVLARSWPECPPAAAVRCSPRQRPRPRPRPRRLATIAGMHTHAHMLACTHTCMHACTHACTHCVHAHMHARSGIGIFVIFVIFGIVMLMMRM